MITFRPMAALLGRAFHWKQPELSCMADEVWEISPEYEGDRSSAVFLPGQVERIKGTAFCPPDWRDQLLDPRPILHQATKGMLFKKAILSDGFLYPSRGSHHLMTISGRTWPAVSVEAEYRRGALYGSYPGTRYFGNWLLDDSLTYLLAEKDGLPVTTRRKKLSAHMNAYREVFGMDPTRVMTAFFEELVIYSDVGQNKSKTDRAALRQQQLTQRFPGKPHPGVFLLRGLSGEKRVLKNEAAIADHMATRYGFTILDPMEESLGSILSACQGAQTVMGVEGSQLVHGVVMMTPGSRLFILQPPSRFSLFYKDITDRGSQMFGFVVGTENSDGEFEIDKNEIDRTMDLFGSPSL